MTEETKEKKTTSPRQQAGEAPVDAASSGGGRNAAPTGEEPVETAATEAEPSQESQSSQESQKPAESAQSSETSQTSQTPSPAEPDWKDLYARLRADFDNFKKRTARDREDTYRYAESDILKDILPTVDNLALALANAVDAASSPVDAASSPRQDKEESSSNERGGGAASTGSAASTAFVKGVQLVYDTLLKSLKDHGAEPFDCVGLPLDTEKMEAIATLPSATVAEGLVSNEVKRGWLLKGKVLRVAQVVVSSGKAQ